MDHKIYIRRCIEISEKAVKNGNNPFGVLLVNKQGKIVVESENVEITEKDCTGHAETTVIKMASSKFSKKFLWDCTLYTLLYVYWGYLLGKCWDIVYGISESKVLELAGSNEINPTFDVPCRDIIAKGQKDIKVTGPIADEKLEEEIVEIHRGFWD